jgi:hypothetical protein
VLVVVVAGAAVGVSGGAVVGGSAGATVGGSVGVGFPSGVAAGAAGGRCRSCRASGVGQELPVSVSDTAMVHIAAVAASRWGATDFAALPEVAPTPSGRYSSISVARSSHETPRGVGRVLRVVLVAPFGVAVSARFGASVGVATKALIDAGAGAAFRAAAGAVVGVVFGVEVRTAVGSSVGVAVGAAACAGASAASSATARVHAAAAAVKWGAVIAVSVPVAAPAPWAKHSSITAVRASPEASRSALLWVLCDGSRVAVAAFARAAGVFCARSVAWCLAQARRIQRTFQAARNLWLSCLVLGTCRVCACPVVFVVGGAGGRLCA